MFGHDEPFQTTNYGVTTTPRKEYEITTGKRDCPDKDKLDKKNRPVRIIRRIDELKQQKAVQKAALEDDEIVAVVRGWESIRGLIPAYFSVMSQGLIVLLVSERQVLYTGPMFQVPFLFAVSRPH